MDELSRNKRRLTIGIVFVLLIIVLGSFVYFAFLRQAPTCFDNKTNQNEEGIDCGGVCALACTEQISARPLEIIETAIIPAGRGGQFDVLGKIRNPNSDSGASAFRYVFEIKDINGSTIATRSATGFILPGEEKYLLALNIEAAAASSVQLTISDVDWERFEGYRGKPAIALYQKRYNELSGGAAFGEAYGLVANESPYDFRSLTVRVILRDDASKPLAVNMTEMRTVRAGEERDFRLLWPTSFPGVVTRVEMEAEADVYNSENFIREYLPSGRFQEFLPPSAF